MTLLVALSGRDGLVLGADSRDVLEPGGDPVSSTTGLLYPRLLPPGHALQESGPAAHLGSPANVPHPQPVVNADSGGVIGCHPVGLTAAERYTVRTVP